jgi:hypothetical protein
VRLDRHPARGVQVNPDGEPGNLVPSHPGNISAVKSGIYSRTGRVLAERAEELARALMEAPHTVALDSIAAEEIGSITAQLEAIDADLEERGKRDRRTLLEHKARLSRELRTWLREFGATPKARFDFAAGLARGGLGEEIRRRREEAAQRG